VYKQPTIKDTSDVQMFGGQHYYKIASKEKKTHAVHLDTPSTAIFPSFSRGCFCSYRAQTFFSTNCLLKPSAD
jgi:hypothetical protein